MEDFSTTLEHRVVTLKTATDVVRFSFIVRNSISYLDLGLCQYSMLLNYLGTSCDCCALKLSKSFINTEEKCRKFFTQSRSLLYTLHLDLPKGRECSLKDVPNYFTFYHNPCIPHIAKIIPTCGFEISILSDFVEDAINSNQKKLKILSWILKMSFSNLPLLYVLKIRTVDKFIDCFYPEITDSAIFKDFIMYFDFTEWISTYEKPEILEYLLYYSRHYRREDLKQDVFPIDEIIDPCIFNRYFLNIGPILKYINVPRFSEDDYHLYFLKISSKRPNLTEERLRKAEKRMKRGRIHQMLQIIWMHIDCRQHHCTEDASEALRLIWCSVPDAYISFKEIKRAFRGILRVEELKNIYDFYAEGVGEFSESVQPSSLQHLRRSIIRSTLRENQIWIPEGLRQTCLPKAIMSFLNLEKVFCTSNEFAL
ncbi:hypothetical protein AVEN_27104-1 [Araneus ventricosus]|uniref:SOCS box domain-containing protein n=1 Tax=Araneus ventricosus TaxID=182803 RepID=A0A4Y2RJ10_ARAVE|nr:hypothetical protein AVEN_27104-1 [Araneus ventricosus]